MLFSCCGVPLQRITQEEVERQLRAADVQVSAYTLRAASHADYCLGLPIEQTVHSEQQS